MAPLDEAGTRRWTLAAMTAALATVFLDETAVSVALPAIGEDLGATNAELAWVVNAFVLVLAILAPVGARLGELLGRTRVLVGAVSVFSLASLVSGVAGSEELLIGARAVQGAGAAAIVPLSTAAVADAFPDAHRGRALGILLGVSSLFLALGPLVGGVITELAGWRWIFLVNLPVAAVTLAIMLRLARASARPRPSGTLDLTGGVLLIAGLGAVVVAMMQAQAWRAELTVGVLVAGGLLLALLVRLEPSRRSPLVPIGLLAEPTYLGASIAAFCGQFLVVGGTVLAAIYIQNDLGLDPLAAGLALLPATVPLLLFAPIGGTLTDRLGARRVVTAGLGIQAGAVLVLALLVSEDRYAPLLPALIAFGAGTSLVSVSTTSAGVDVHGSQGRNEAAGFITTARQVGGTVGLAVMATIFVTVDAGDGGTPGVGEGTEAALFVAAAVGLSATLAAFALIRAPVARVDESLDSG